ncbi:BRO family protein [Mucilaginibacter galii]|uniref:DNA damage-inducible protein D n=1 Tax=Mucilaginibacter galii TaxID=2005073 RepID=A0A917J9I6_9SPHI|nr:BRO family protein [Mucilaginibacter galii]GGI50447.1 DNA damage-inducible protein D [Mucilaginibacter galii]
MSEENDNSVQQKPLLFEDYSHENGITYWWASDFAKMLGYPNLTSFSKPIHRAMQACLTINIDTHDNFQKTDRVVDGVSISDYKLTRFSCYMVAMNGDIKKPEVARAQAYFAKQAEQLSLLLSGANDVDRLIIREEIKDGNKSLMSVAKKSGVSNFARFNDAGYLGMYNMRIQKLAVQKGLKSGEPLLDYMGKTELSANLFRIALTEENLKQQIFFSEAKASNVHRQVGADIRAMVKKNTGLNPEELPIERRLGEVGSELKKANKHLNKKKNNPPK